MAHSPFTAGFNPYTIADMRLRGGHTQHRGTRAAPRPSTSQVSHFQVPTFQVPTSRTPTSQVPTFQVPTFQVSPVPTPDPTPAWSSEAGTLHLVKYHLCGGSGWQRIFGNDRATDVQPIQLIQAGKIHGMTISHSGMGTIEAGRIYICKNIEPDLWARTPEADQWALLQRYAVGSLNLTHQIKDAVTFTILPGELLPLRQISWEFVPHSLDRDDRISIYAPNLSGAVLDLYVAYT